ncbi:MAG TPA: 50S ribosomal protein L31 [Phycisphaerales bacterium]|nr:50S ribosomal protein L31 [Phycisphaerales bacterium]
MKKDTHPTMHPCKVYYNGEVVMEVGATVPELHVDVWSGSHPFFTGKQTFVDATGRLERFQNRFKSGYFKKPDTKKGKKTRK